MSGIKAHTLRVWEKRYGIIKPRRTENNIRYFLDEDLKHILNIALLNKNGHKISKIAEMGNEEISTTIKSIAQEPISEQDDVESMTIAILELDSASCKSILNKVVGNVGFEACINGFIYPLLDKLSVMWISGSLKPVHESFIRTIIKNKVCSEIGAIQKDYTSDVKFLIYLPENENQELSTLFLEFILKKKGAEVINLGNNVNVHDLYTASEIYKPDYAFTIINDSLQDESLQSMIDFLSSHMPQVTHLFTGFQFVKQELNLGPNCKYVENLNAVEQYI